jgi:diguanylate cyclase (GGDEF)-like protein
VLLCAELVGLRRINQQFGYCEGNQALSCAAHYLKKAFRNSGVIARVSGNQFGILAINVTSPQATILTENLRVEIAISSPERTGSYRLGFRSGMAWGEPSSKLSLVDLWGRALEALNAGKRRKAQA